MVLRFGARTRMKLTAVFAGHRQVWDCRRHDESLAGWRNTWDPGPSLLLLQEGGPLPGPETGLLSNTRKWTVRGDTCWQSKRFYWERAPGWRAVGKGTQENCSAAWLAVLGFMVMGLVSGWPLANHSNSVFPGGARIAQPRWMLARGILESGQTGRVSSRPFPNSSGWWWLISSIFLIRMSCHKTTLANGYYGAWPGWAVSISVLPLTVLLRQLSLHIKVV